MFIMKIEDYMIYIIETYINDIIEDLSINKELEDSKEETKKYENEIKALESLNIEDYNNILNDITENSDFVSILYDTLNKHIYSYIDSKELK